MTIADLSKLSDEELNVRLAELRGERTKLFRFWYSGHDQKRPYRTFETREAAEQDRKREIRWGCGEVEEYTNPHITRYSTDLNAVAAVEAGLTIEQRVSYVNKLLAVTEDADLRQEHSPTHWKCCSKPHG